MAETVSESIETTEQVNTENINEQDNNSQGTEELTYTKTEVTAMVSKAVNSALEKARKNSAKSNDELTAELNDLKAQLQRKDNESYVSNEINARHIPSELTHLFYSEDNDVSKSKLDTFSKWFASAVDAAVDARLSETKVPSFNASDIARKQYKSLSDMQRDYNNRR